MIFAHTWQQVLDGRKRETRRPVTGATASRYREGRTYAVQPGRGRHAVARIIVTGIRVERLQCIDHAGAVAEGCGSVDSFRMLWDSIHRRPGERWEDNPLVRVITFKLMEGEHGCDIQG